MRTQMPLFVALLGVALLGASGVIGPQRAAAEPVRWVRSAAPRQVARPVFRAGGEPAPFQPRVSPGRLSDPEMRSFAELVATEGKAQPLAGFAILGIQHLLGSTGGLMRGLAASGAAISQMLFIGKRYSQHAGVAGELSGDGFRTYLSRHEGSIDTGADWGHRVTGDPGARLRELRAQVDDLVRRTPTGKIVVIDDGGELIELIHREYAHLHDRVVAVEQTRRGIRRLEKLDLKFAVIDVAQSWAKLHYESPMIGRSIAATTLARVRWVRGLGAPTGRRALLLGYGAVGKATARALHAAGFDVEVFDTSRDAQRTAGQDPSVARTHHALDDALTSGARIVLSLTGTTTLGERELELLHDGAMLINGASSSDEIVDRSASFMQPLQGFKMHGGAPYARWGEGAESRTGMRASWILKTRSGKAHLLVNRGEVINFDGSPDPIPPRYIQLTRGLLYLGALQAARTTKAGIHSLDEVAQRAWVERVERELAATGESLVDPTF